MRKSKIFLTCIMAVIVLIIFSQKIYATSDIEIKYNYDEQKNQVTARIISDIELKDTKPTWQLSEDRKTYTKIYTKNEEYETPVTDINGQVTYVNVQITQIKDWNVDIEYEYLEETNQVMATIKSNVELKDTKPTWQLSEDKKMYTKIYSDNENYTTPVTDINGNVQIVSVEIEKVKKLKIDVKYIPNTTTNQVEVELVSNLVLQDTKPTWQLSEDKKVYTKIYSDNENYTTSVKSINGEVVNVEINVNQVDKTPPKITLEYKHNDDDTVTIYMKSDEELGETKPTWQLLSDRKTYQKTFSDNQDYSTSVEDIYGNKINVKIQFSKKYFSYVQEDNSIIQVRYLYIEQKETIVEIKSSIKMKDTKPTWKLSDDGYTYTKTFTNNNIYVTPIVDINGVTKKVNILVNMFDDYLLGIDVSHHNGTIDWEEVKASGIDFVIIRCGYGQNIASQDDTKFEYNIEQCEKLGISYGVYLYSYATNINSASSEADHVLRLIKGHNPQYGIWLDLEEDAKGVNFVDIALTFLEKMKNNGYNDIGIYANLDWWNNKLNDSRLDQYNKWIAQWGDSCDYSGQYKMWQYTSSGRLQGVPSEKLDMDIYYK